MASDNFKLRRVIIKLLLPALIFSLMFSGASLGGEKAEIFVQLGHSDNVQSLAFSPDGKLLASGSGDKTVKLWDVETGREIRTMATETGFTAVAFSPDGRILASAGGISNDVVLWSVKDGRTVRKLRMDGDHNYLNDVAFSPDGTTVAAASHIIQFFNAATGRTIKVIKNISENSRVNSIAFSPDGKYLASGSGWTSNNSKDNTVRLWDVKTGEEIHRFSGHSRDVIRVSFSPDGRYLASFSEDKDIVIWDIKKREKTKTLKGHVYNRGSIAFSPDGRYIADADFYILRLWDFSAGRTKTILKDDDSGTGIHPDAVSISPNGRYAAVSAGYAVSLWDIVDGRKIRMLGGSVKITFDSYFSRSDGNVKIIGPGGTETFHRFQGYYSGLQNTALNVDKRFLRDCNDESCRIVDKKTGTTVITIPTMDYYSQLKGDITYSPDGKYALISPDKDSKIVDLKNKRPATVLEGSPAGSKLSDRAVFSNDGKYIAGWPYSTGDIPVICLWETSTGRQIFKKSLKEIVWTAVFTADGKKIVAGSGDNIYLLDAMTGKEIRTYSGHTDSVGSIAMSEDGKYLLSGSWDGKIKLWDFQTGREIRTFTGHTNWVTSVTFSGDGKNVLSGSRDSTTRLWETATGKEIAQFISFNDGEWIVITPEGFFNASINGAKYLNVRVGYEVFSIDQFYTRFFRPDMVQLALAGRELPKAKEGFAEIAARIPAPSVEIIKPRNGESVDQESARLSVKVTDNGGGIGNVNVYVNGSQVANETRGVVIKGKGGGKERILAFDISLIEGKNEVRIAAFNREGSMESNPAMITLFSKKTSAKPSLHAIVIGINQYKNESISLKYAVSDALAFTETLRKTSGPLFGSVNVYVLTSFAETTKDSIKRSFEQIRDKVKPNDVFVFYDASHGIIDIVDDQEQYFLLTSNVFFLSSRHIGKEALGQKELSGLIGSIPAQKKFIILDTCHAGRAGKEITVALLQQTRGLTESTAVKLLQRAIGSTVFSSSSDTQQALEGYHGHGLFTYVLNEGLMGKADVRKDGFITINALGEYVEEEVARLSKDVFKRQQVPTIQIGVNFPIGKVK